MKSEPTQILAIDGKQILVKSLPAELQSLVEVLDTFRQRQLDTYIELEMVTHAVASKTSQVNQKVAEFLAGESSNGNAS